MVLCVPTSGAWEHMGARLSYTQPAEGLVMAVAWIILWVRAGWRPARDVHVGNIWRQRLGGGCEWYSGPTGDDARAASMCVHVETKGTACCPMKNQKRLPHATS